MHLESSILIDRSPDRVWRFLSDIANIPKWDRGVAAVHTGPAGVTGIGSEFDTVADTGAETDAPRSGRMGYRIADMDAERGWCRVELTSRDGNARFFRRASWTFRTSGVAGGTRLTCAADFTLRPQWLILAPVLYLMRRAIMRDLQQLKAAVET